MKVLQFIRINQSIIAILRDYLAQAENGEFTTITIIGSHADGSISHQTSETNDYIRHTGALTIALHRHLMNAPTEGEDE